MPRSWASGRCAMSEQTTLCEYQGCDATAWRVLFWGPNKTGPCRAACWQHQGESDLAAFTNRYDSGSDS